MTDLDLLPLEYRPKSAVNPRNLLLILLSLGIAFILVIITMSLIEKSQSYTTLLTELQAQVIPYQRQYRDIQLAQEKLKTLEERLPLIETLISQRILWSERLESLHESLPRDGIWFDEITVLPHKDKELGGRSATSQPGRRQDSEEVVTIAEMPWIKISAWAKTVEDMSAWIQSIEESPGFRPPILLTARESEVGGQKLIFFELRVHLKELTPQTAHAGLQLLADDL